MYVEFRRIDPEIDIILRIRQIYLDVEFRVTHINYIITIRFPLED